MLEQPKYGGGLENAVSAHEQLSLTHCTLTGVDESADLDAIAGLSQEFPLVEWGFLYSPKRQGEPGRYPAISTIASAFQSLPAQVRVALHICGDGVFNLMAGQTNELHLLNLVAGRSGRIQLNFNQMRRPLDLADLAALLVRYRDTTFITQENAANQSVWGMLAERAIANHAVLFDQSGGLGIACAEWPRPLPISCGYAGGLGPHNLDAELPRIARVAGGRPTWVDMEGNLRRFDGAGIDWLSLDACRACLEATRAPADPAARTQQMAAQLGHFDTKQTHNTEGRDIAGSAINE